MALHILIGTYNIHVICIRYYLMHIISIEHYRTYKAIFLFFSLLTVGRAYYYYYHYNITAFIQYIIAAAIHEKAYRGRVQLARAYSPTRTHSRYYTLLLCERNAAYIYIYIYVSACGRVQRVCLCIYIIMYKRIFVVHVCVCVISVGKSHAEKERRSESDRAACFAWHTIVRDQWVGERSVHCALLVCRRNSRGPPALCPLITQLRRRRRDTRIYNIIYASGSGNFFPLSSSLFRVTVSTRAAAASVEEQYYYNYFVFLSICHRCRRFECVRDGHNIPTMTDRNYMHSYIYYSRAAVVPIATRKSRQKHKRDGGGLRLNNNNCCCRVYIIMAFEHNSTTRRRHNSDELFQ